MSKTKHKPHRYKCITCGKPVMEQEDEYCDVCLDHLLDQSHYDDNKYERSKNPEGY